MKDVVINKIKSLGSKYQKSDIAGGGIWYDSTNCHNNISSIFVGDDYTELFYYDTMYEYGESGDRHYYTDIASVETILNKI